MTTEDKPPANDTPVEPEKPRSWLSRLGSRLFGWLGGQEYHYAGYLPSRPGFLLRWTLDPFFSRVEVKSRYQKRINELAKKGAVVYALKYRSHLDFLFFNRRYQHLGVKAPEVAFDLNLWMWQPFSHMVQIASATLNYFTRRRSWPNPFQDGYFQRILEDRRGSLVFCLVPFE